jgi:outer membrane protein TolC
LRFGVVEEVIGVKNPVKGIFLRERFARFVFVLVAFLAFVAPAWCQEAAQAPIFPKMRVLDLGECRALALKRSAKLALAGAQLAQAQAELKDQRNRFKLGTGGGIGFGVNPNAANGGAFSNKVSFYLSLDLERLLQLNKAEREKARQAVEAERIGQTTAELSTQKDVTTAWYGVRSAEAGVLAAQRYRETAQALHLAADARFKAGQGELSGVLASLRGTWESEAAYEQARRAVILACLDLAQSCGYATAEEMEAAL